MTNLPPLKSDCSKCAALCCFVPAFDESDEFAVDKPSQTACSNLCTTGKDAGLCNIHPELKDKGFGGCIRYECHGAGQYLTQEVFKGRSWMDEPDLVPRMGETFPIMEKIHEQIVLLNTAKKLPLSASEASQADTLMNLLCPASGWTEESLLRFVENDKPKRVPEFMKSLRHHAKALSILMSSDLI